MADRGSSTLTKLGFAVLAFNSALAIHNSWGRDDAASVAFVLAALVLLFLCLRAFELGGVRGRDAAASAKAKAAVWALTTLLTAMFATRVAALMPVAVGVLVFLCLRDVDHQTRGGGRGNMGGQGQYCALAKVGVAVLTCDSALGAYGARRDSAGSASAAFVLVSYVVLVILTGLFVRAVARAHAAEQGQR